jgi:hypothetical protein
LAGADGDAECVWFQQFSPEGFGRQRGRERRQLRFHLPLQPLQFVQLHAQAIAFCYRVSQIVKLDVMFPSELELVQDFPWVLGHYSFT